MRLLISLFLILAGNAFCQHATTTEAAASTNAADAKPLRDPFWPVDFVPAGSEVVTTPSPTQTVTTADVDTPPPQAPTVAPTVAPTPAPTVAPTAVPTPTPAPTPATVKWPTLKLKGLIKGAGGKYVAQIDGVGLVESGRIVRIKTDKVEFSWGIGEITKDGVEIKRLEARPIR